MRPPIQKWNGSLPRAAGVHDSAKDCEGDSRRDDPPGAERNRVVGAGPPDCEGLHRDQDPSADQQALDRAIAGTLGLRSHAFHERLARLGPLIWELALLVGVHTIIYAKRVCRQPLTQKRPQLGLRPLKTGNEALREAVNVRNFFLSSTERPSPMQAWILAFQPPLP